MTKLPTNGPSAPTGHHEDWGEAPDVSTFYGRENERQRLRQWIDHGRIVGVLGQGGIGKTTLVTRVAKDLAADFDCIVWRSLRNQPFPQDLLNEIIPIVSGEQQHTQPHSIDEQIAKLVECFDNRRCLLVLDNGESILRERERDTYAKGYEGYGRLLRQVAQTPHRSCLVLTSREEPPDFAEAVGSEVQQWIHALSLDGLGPDEVRKVLDDMGITATPEECEALVERYNGNPLALKLIADPIRTQFRGRVSRLLASDEVLFSDVRRLIEQQFERSTELDQQMLYWLAIVSEATSADVLADYIVPSPTGPQTVNKALKSLAKRSLARVGVSGTLPVETRYSLDPVVQDYVLQRLVRSIRSELEQGNLDFFFRYPFMQAQATDFVRKAQQQMVLAPVKDWFQQRYRISSELDDAIRAMLSQMRALPDKFVGYGPGNVLNLLCHLDDRVDVRRFDFSYMTIMQADLRSRAVRYVDFSNATFVKSLFAETFGYIQSVAFSVDGTLLAAGSAGGDVLVFDVVDRKPLAIVKHSMHWVRAVAFSPDGRLLASGSDDKTIVLWEIDREQEDAISVRKLRTLQADQGFVRSVAFSPNRRLLASGGADASIRLWDAHTGAIVGRLEGHHGTVWSVAFSPDGRLLASGSEDETINLWDPESRAGPTTLAGHEGFVKSVAFSPDGRVLASASHDCTVRMWDPNTCEYIRTLEGHNGLVMSVAFSPDGKLLASASYDQSVRLWKAKSGEFVEALEGHRNGVRAVAFNPEHKRMLASGSEDQSLRLWDTINKRGLQTFQGYSYGVRAIALSPDGRLLATGSEDGTVALWNVDTGNRIRVLHKHRNWVLALAFDPDGSTLASGGDDRAIYLWNVDSGECTDERHDHTDWVMSLAFSPDGWTLASGSDDRTVRLWDLRNNTSRSLGSHAGRVWSVAFRSDGSLFSASEDTSIKRWDIQAGNQGRNLGEHSNGVRSIAVSPDGKLLASGGDDQTIKIWKVRSGKSTSLSGHSGRVLSVAFHPGGKVLASGGDDMVLKVWDLETGAFEELYDHRYRFKGRVLCVAFSPDGKTLAGGSEDGTFQLWNHDTRSLLREPRAIERLYQGTIFQGAAGLTLPERDVLKEHGALV